MNTIPFYKVSFEHQREFMIECIDSNGVSYIRYLTYASRDQVEKSIKTLLAFRFKDIKTIKLFIKSADSFDTQVIQFI